MKRLSFVPSSLVQGAVLAAAMSCQGAAPPATAPPDYEPAPPRAGPGDPVPAPSIEPSPAPVASAAPTPAPEDLSNGSCPKGMLLVEGDYCTQVVHKCLIEWYAPQNKKDICEQFQQTARCVGTRVHKRYCIDKFAWPNQAGVRPEVMNTFYQAQIKCAALGKRMCTESEWTFACEGPEMKPFPYGFTRDPRKCNGDHGWDAPNMKKVGKRDARELARLWKGVPSGSQPECVSDFGVHDLPGNVDEVCAGETHNAKFSAVNTGGPWYSGVRNQCRPKVYTHDEGFFYYYLGFRCCSDPDGQANEPLTTKQRGDGWKLKRVEGLAGFTVAQMKEVLVLKEKGECNCDGNSLPGLTLKGPRYLCKTMCGTLLADGAKDGDDSTRMLHPSRSKITAP